jgi:hypothetical protein
MTIRLAPEEIRRDTKILDQSADQGEVAAAAVALAGAEDDEAIQPLYALLSNNEGLARLDNVSDPSLETQNLVQVFRALAEHPTPATGQLCESLFAAEDFRAVPARINMLLAALCAVVPTSVEGADVFRASIEQGFAEVIGPPLLRNASPLALEVFEELIRGASIDARVRVDILHRALLPMRYSLPVLQMCDRLLEAELEPDVRAGLIETLFDYQSRRWFGPAMYPPQPLAWEFASPESLAFLMALAERLLAESLDSQLKAPIQATLQELQSLLAPLR